MRKYLFAFLLMMLPIFSHAGESISSVPEKPELYEVTSIEDVEQDLTKRLILGVLGKDALIAFIGTQASDELKTSIKGLSDSDVYRISKPFNSSIISGTLIIIAAFFLVAVTTMLFYILWVYSESLLKTQDSGEFLGGRWSKVFTPLKIVIGFFLIFPMFGQSHAPFTGTSNDENLNLGAFSLAQLAVLTSAGASSHQANIIFGEFIRSMPKNYPAITMPNVTSKAPFMENLIDFMVCAKSSYGQNITLPFHRLNSDEKGAYKLDVSVGKCNITGQIGYDMATVEELKNNKTLTALIGNVNYEQIQNTAIQNALNNAFQTANTVANAIITAEDSINIFKTPANLNAKDWRNYCSSLGSILPEDAPDDDVLFYNSIAGKCMSKQFIEDLSKTSLDSSYIYGDTNYLKGNAIELCVHDSSFTGKQKALTFAKFNEDEFVSGTKYKLIRECVSSACSGDKAFECASAIHFAKSVADKDEMAKKGWIVGGATVYKIFSGFDNMAARSIINKSNFDVEFFDDVQKTADNLASSAGVINTITVSANAISPESSYDYSDFLNYIGRKENRYESLITERGQYSSFLDGGRDGWFGIPKLQSCAEHPMQVSNGFVCGSVTEEVHIFGSKLIALGLQVKMASLLITQKSGAAKKKYGEISNRTTGAVKNFSSYIDGPIAKIFIGAVMGSAFRETDSFSDIDSEIWLQYPEIISFIASITAVSVTNSDVLSESVSMLINIFVGLCITLGVIFGYLMPLLPFGLWLIAVGGWIIALFEALVLCQIWGVVLISPSADHSSEAARKSTIIVVSILLKAPLLVAGMIVAWLLNNILMSEMLIFSDISTALALDSAGTLKSIVDQLVVLIIYFVILYGMYNIIFSLIEGFEKITIDVLFSGESMSPFAAKQRDGAWASSVNSAMSAASKTLIKG